MCNYYTEDYLAHHGILGMKWGVRHNEYKKKVYANKALRNSKPYANRRDISQYRANRLKKMSVSDYANEFRLPNTSKNDIKNNALQKAADVKLLSKDAHKYDLLSKKWISVNKKITDTPASQIKNRSQYKAIVDSVWK